MSSRAKYEPFHCFYRQDPLPFYSRPEYRIRRPLPDVPDHIMVWADSRSRSIDYTKEEELRVTSAFPPFSPHLLSFRDLNEEQLRIVAESLTLHVLQADQVAWHYYEEIVYDKQHLLSLRKKFFKIFATFALQIFDLEDFVRVVEKPMILKNVWEFCDCLEDTFGVDNPEKVASKATTDISTGKINMEKYPFFWQTDADCILGCYRDKSHLNIEYVLDQVASTYHEDIISIVEPLHVLHKHYITTALEAIKDHKPLQEGKKLDLMLNADKRRCVLRQALYLEAWRGFVKDDLAGLYLVERGPHWEETFILSFHETLNNLAVMKARLASSSEKNFRSLAECGTLGNFSKEVVEAVRIANFERMRLGYRFLTTGHLLFGLSRSRVADKIKVFEKTWVPTREVKEIHGTNLLYCILRHASNVANNLGLEEVLLEHLYLATKFATRLLPTKKMRTDDDIKQLIDWNSIFQQVAITSFLEESAAAEPELKSSPGEMSEEVLWGHFFKDYCMPGSPKLMFETLAKEFKDNNFKHWRFVSTQLRTRTPQQMQWTPMDVFDSEIDNTFISTANTCLLSTLGVAWIKSSHLKLHNMVSSILTLFSACKAHIRNQNQLM